MGKVIEHNCNIYIYIFAAILFILGISFNSHAEDTSQYVDFKTYDSNVTLQHTHIYVTEFDDNNHWERCTVCDDIRNKAKHSLHGNGNSMYRCGNWYNDAYKEICSCGYETKPFYVIHGRWENYTSCKKLNYQNNPGNLSNVMQITKATFNSTFSGKTHDGQEYTWYDDDGDGYGWVFCGGPIMGDSNGVKSSLALILGSTSGFGRNYELDEFYTIARYIAENKNITRSQFVSKLKSKSQLNTNHCLYGMKEKYSNITDAQWAKILKLFEGYYIKQAEYTWNVMFVRHSSHQSSGNALYRHERCYDSNLGRRHSYSDGVAATCDICECVCTGNEEYLDLGMFGTPTLYDLKEGETKQSSTYTIYGLGKTKLATVYCVYSRKNNKYYQDKMVVKAESGVTVTNTNADNIELKPTKILTRSLDWGSFNIKFTYTYNGTTYTKNNQFRYYYPFIDNTAPVIKAVDQKTQTEKNGWATIKQITVKGTEDYCTQVKIKLYDVATGKQVGSTYTVNATNNAYSFSFTPQIEGPSSGRKYKVVATDLYGNSSEKQFTVYKTDGTAPAIQSSASYLDWSGVKTITLKYTDFGTGADNSAKGVWVSFGDQKNFQKITDNGNGNYSVTYKFGKEVTGGVKYRVYAKDSLGNVTVNTITVGNIDRTAPVIKNATVAVGSKSTVVSATDDRSGVASYGVSANTTAPKTWQTGNTLTQNDYGVYYVFVKDKAGNVSAYRKVTIGIFEIYYKLDNGTNDSSNPTTYQVDTAVSFKSPTRKGYTFDGWYEDSNFKNKVTGIPTGSTGNKTVYAKWNINTYKITYVLYGGEETSNPATYTVETPTFTLKNPALSGFSFLGWTSPSSKEPKSAYQIPKGSIGDITVSANWVSGKLSDDSLNNQGGNGSSDSGNSDNSDPDNARSKNTKTQHNKISIG